MDCKSYCTNAGQQLVSYCAKCFENTMKSNFSEPNNLCLKEMILISKCSKSRLLGISKLLPANTLTDLVLCLKAGNTVFSATVLHGIGQDGQERPYLALDQAFLFLVQGTSTLGDVLINLRGVIVGGNSHLAFTLLLHNLLWTVVESKAVFWHPSF